MQLDDAYANADYIPDGAGYPARWAAAAGAWRAQRPDGAPDLMDVPYGAGPRERFDLFRPAGRPQGLAIFVHGGYWLDFDRSFWSHLAAGALARGWAMAMPSYDLCPGTDIAAITAQTARAVVAAARQVDGPVALAGHSAGGQLVARMLAPGMLPQDVAARLHRVVPISPLADLRPLLQTSMAADLHLTPATAAAGSPVLQPAPTVPVHVWVGAKERPAFLDQAQWLAGAWGVPCTVAEGRHHFDVFDPLAAPDSALTGALLG